MSEFVINDEALLELFGQTNGPVAQELERQADRIITKTQENLSHPWVRGGERNPPPGPPQRRTGDLRQSVRRVPTGLDDDGVVAVDIVADAVHAGHLYSVTLRDKGYEFISELDLESLAQ